MAATEVVKGISPPEQINKLVAVSASVDAREIGTLYHKVLYHIPLAATDVKEEFDRLIRRKIFTPEEIKLIDGKCIEKILTLQIIRRAASVAHYREQPFMILVPAKELSPAQDGGDNVMAQGVIDLLFIEKDGATVVDYKYSDRDARSLLRLYKGQVVFYARSVATVLGIPITGKYIVNIKTGEVISVC
jgi:ATP-dependent helicase/nuclease subunit A